VSDIAQSVLDRLKNKGRAAGKTTQLMLQLFCQEEFLRRLQLSAYHERLILKGGLLLYSLSGFTGRPTVDVDLLARSIRSELPAIEKVVREIAQVNTGNDYVTFEIKGTEPITELSKYGGVRVRMVGHIKNTMTAFHVDVGVGDVIVPRPIERTVPGEGTSFIVRPAETVSGDVGREVPRGRCSSCFREGLAELPRGGRVDVGRDLSDARRKCKPVPWVVDNWHLCRAAGKPMNAAGKRR
jgi:hypothetical protein